MSSGISGFVYTRVNSNMYASSDKTYIIDTSPMCRGLSKLVDNRYNNRINGDISVAVPRYNSAVNSILGIGIGLGGVLGSIAVYTPRNLTPYAIEKIEAITTPIVNGRPSSVADDIVVVIVNNKILTRNPIDGGTPVRFNRAVKANRAPFLVT